LSNIPPLDSAIAAFTAAKVAATAQLTAMVVSKNAGQQITNADLTLLVNLFNGMTTQSNSLRALISTVIVALQNLTDTQFETIGTNPVQYFCSGYLVLVNSLLQYDQATGLTIADLVRDDLVKDINDAFANLAAGVTDPVPSVIFDSTNALNIALSAGVAA
jgi:hypothetical protein